MRKVLLRIDAFLLVMAGLAAYSGWKNDNGILLEHIWPLITVFFIVISKRTANGRGISGLFAYLGTAFYIIMQWKDLLYLETISLLYVEDIRTALYAALGAIALLYMLFRLTTCALTVMWTVYFVLVTVTIISNHSLEDMISLLNSPAVIASTLTGYSSTLLLAIIGGIFADLQFRNRSVRES